MTPVNHSLPWFLRGTEAPAPENGMLGRFWQCGSGRQVLLGWFRFRTAKKKPGK